MDKTFGSTRMARFGSTYEQSYRPATVKPNEKSPAEEAKDKLSIARPPDECNQTCSFELPALAKHFLDTRRDAGYKPRVPRTF